jgi:hypothetical protein
MNQTVIADIQIELAELGALRFQVIRIGFFPIAIPKTGAVAIASQPKIMAGMLLTSSRKNARHDLGVIAEGSTILDHPLQGFGSYIFNSVIFVQWLTARVVRLIV